jgi:hypothetical protein
LTEAFCLIASWFVGLLFPAIRAERVDASAGEGKIVVAGDLEDFF